MGASGAPKTVTPGEAADAAVGTSAAGEMMAIGNQPIEQYSNLVTSEQLGPAEMQTQQALANQAAYQGALAQQDIQSRVDPLAYAQRQMRLKQSTDRLGQLYGQDPSQFTFRAPQAYTVPGTANTPSVTDLSNTARGIANNLNLVDVNGAGQDPRFQGSTGNNIAVTNPQSYFKA